MKNIYGPVESIVRFGEASYDCTAVHILGSSPSSRGVVIIIIILLLLVALLFQIIRRQLLRMKKEL